ncbi:MAG: response regulator [Methanoregula sp.]|jgi:CheY-like chemotaxis protein
MDRAKILIVEDEREVAKSLEMRLKKFGFSVAGHAGTAEAAIKKADALRPDIVLMDIDLGGKMDGVQAADYIRKNYHIPVIYLTALCDTEILERVGATAPYGYILKPFKDDELRTVIDIALEIQANK